MALIIPKLILLSFANHQDIIDDDDGTSFWRRNNCSPKHAVVGLFLLIPRIDDPRIPWLAPSIRSILHLDVVSTMEIVKAQMKIILFSGTIFSQIFLFPELVSKQKLTFDNNTKFLFLKYKFVW